MKKFYLFLILLLSTISVTAQTIKGNVSDSTTGEKLVGVTVYSKNHQKGSSTDLDGNFSLSLPEGKSTLEIRYISYKNQIVEINLTSDTVINILLNPVALELSGVTVSATIDRGSTTELIRLQSKSAVVLDGVNSEQFKKTPDSKISDVFKRVSGASIQDNKFIVIRGLNDRYNFGMINGSPLPSSESDKRAFSFDIFPSSMLDGLVIYKTASPDLPGEFSGGVINLSTLEPKDKIHNLQIGLGYNAISTFRPYSTYTKSGIDYLGLGSFDREMPELPSTIDWKLLDKNQKADLAKSMNWNWSTNKSRSSLPIGNISYTVGKDWKFKKTGSLGVVFGWYYQYSETVSNLIRRDFEEQSTGVILKMELKDSLFTSTVLNTGMFNLNWRINENNVIKFRSLYSINSEDKVNIRNGVRECDNDPRQWEKSTNFWYSQNNLSTNQLNGKHEFKKWNFNWNLGLSDVRRDIPNLRRIVYRKYSLLENDTTEKYVAVIQSNGTIPTAAGNMFWSNSNEQIYSGSYNFIIPIKVKKLESEVKFGGWHQLREKDFTSRNFGFSQYKPTGSQFDSQLLLLGPDEIFSPQNLGLLSNGKGGFKLEEATSVDDSYWASSLLNAGYAMLDSKLDKVRLVGGLRVESYNQKFNYVEFGSNLEKKIDTTVVDFLPSVNLIYSFTDKIKLRGGYSRTVSRPEFRELAPFSFYNFIQDNIVSGNTNLKRTIIDNFDLRLEYFPGKGQVVSISGFYKNLINPIELINRTGTSGAPELYFTNVDSAMNLGGELELRTNLGFISHNKILDNLTIYTNVSLIHSEVKLDDFVGSGGTRPLQGQSPYIINCGLFYQTPNKDLNVNLSYNYIGPRIYIVGNVQEPSVWENGRNVLDIQITKTIKEKIELKLNFKDVIAQNQLYFQDLNNNNKYEIGDNRWQEINFGQFISFSFNYKF